MATYPGDDWGTGWGPGWGTGWAGLSTGTTDPDVPPPTTTVVTGWESDQLLTRFWRNLGRGNGGLTQGDELWTADASYIALADAQESVYADLAPRVPNAFVSAPTLLTTSDGGVTYDFPAYPFAHVEVYARLDGGRQLLASTFNNRAGDFLFEGRKLRSPGNHPRLYASGPWARFTGFPQRISATVNASLDPPEATELVLLKACSLASDVWGAELDSGPWETKYAAAFRKWLLFYKTQDPTQGYDVRGATTAWWLQLSNENGR